MDGFYFLYLSSRVVKLSPYGSITLLCAKPIWTDEEGHMIVRGCVRAGEDDVAIRVEAVDIMCGRKSTFASRTEDGSYNYSFIRCRCTAPF